jgi:DNA polymerase III subunit delta
MLSSTDDIISNKRFPQILLIFGEEEFQIEESYRKILKYIHSSNISDYDIELLEATDTDLKRIVDSCSAYPFLSPVKFIAVKNFQTYFSGTRKKTDENSPLTRYFNNPSPTTFLLLLASTDSLKGLKAASTNQKSKAQKIIDSAKFPYNILAQKFDLIEFPKIYEADYPDWIVERLESLGYTISADALQFLIAQSNSSLREITNEIEKIIIYLQDKRGISLKEVVDVKGGSHIYNVFELQKAVGRRNLPTAINILENMLKDERQEMLIITILMRYFSSLWRLLDAGSAVNNQYQLASAAGISPYFIKEYLEALKKYKPEELDKAFVFLCEADERLKSSPAGSIAVMQEMLVKIMRK